MNGAHLSVLRFSVDIILVYIYSNAITCLENFAREQPEDFGLSIAIACLVGLDAICSIFSAVEGGLNFLGLVLHPACLAALLLGGRVQEYYRNLFHPGVICVFSAVPPMISVFMQVFYLCISKARWD